MPQRFERGTWQVYDCLSASRNWLPLGRLDQGIWFTLAVIRKLPNAHAVVPQQSLYTDTWQASETNGGCTANPDEEPPNTRAGRLLKATEKSKALHFFARTVIRVWRKLINWYREKKLGRVPFRFVGRY